MAPADRHRNWLAYMLIDDPPEEPEQERDDRSELPEDDSELTIESLSSILDPRD